MKSTTLYKVSNLDITDTLSLLQDDKEIGTISPNGNSLTVSRNTFYPFSCTYNTIIKDDILVQIDSELIPSSEYQKANSFSAFYCKQKNLLFIFAPSLICKGFIKALKETYPSKVAIDSPIQFPFDKIKTFENCARGLYFTVDETTVASKHFFGTDVEQNDEAVEAIDEQRATYLMAQIDILKKARTIGFSKKGALVMYSKPDDINVANPYLELAVEVLQAIQLWK